MAHLVSVNLGSPEPNPYKSAEQTGFGKQPMPGRVEVRAPGPKRGGEGSGLVGDFIGDRRHHGGDYQAVYAVAREDLDRWQERLRYAVPDGFFGENLTTAGLDVNGARIGERWRIGADVVLQVRSPRMPCSTFRGRVGERGWLKSFTADARPGAYLEVISGGYIVRGDDVVVVHRPDHDVTVSLAFRALSTEPELLPGLEAAAADLEPELLDAVTAVNGRAAR